MTRTTEPDKQNERILSAVDSAFAGDSVAAVRRAGGTKVGALLEEVADWGVAWRRPDRNTGEFRVLLEPEWPRPSQPPAALDECHAQTLALGLLYGHRVVAECPLTIRTILEGATDAGSLATVLHRLNQYRPLVEDGSLLLVPQEYLVSSLTRKKDWKRDIGALFADEELFPPRATFESHFEAYWSVVRVADGLLLASKTAAVYAPQQGDWPYLLSWLRSARGDLVPQGVELKILPALATVDLPRLAKLGPETLARVRGNDENFEDWRRALRATVRLIQTAPTDRAFASDARGAIEDFLLPAAARVRRSVSRSRALRGGLREDLARLAIGSVAGIGIGEVLGTSDIASVLAGGAGAFATGLALRALFPDSPSGEAAIIAHFVR